MSEQQAIRDWAIKQYVEKTTRMGTAQPIEATWEWGKCGLCLFTWRDKDEQHDENCPAKKASHD